jgi:hypothetical protein
MQHPTPSATPVLTPQSLTPHTQSQQAPEPRAAYYVRSLFEFGEQLYAWELYAEAADLFRYLASRVPGQPWPWFWLARCHEELGDPMLAAKFYEVAGGVGDRATFALLAARAWTRAGFPDRTRTVLQEEAMWQA